MSVMQKFIKQSLIFLFLSGSFSVFAAVSGKSAPASQTCTVTVVQKNSNAAPSIQMKDAPKKTSTPTEVKLKQQIQELQNKITVQNSVLAKQRHQQAAIADNPLGIAFDEPTYILPFYYTFTPDQTIYAGQTPDQQTLNKAEFKMQFSLLIPIIHHLFFNNLGLDCSYTQLAYWQFYAKSQYFRETDYEPAIFLTGHLLENAGWRFGFVHQSNGRGGDYERSWNRLYLDWRISGQSWLLSIKPWMLVFKSESSSLHNPDIARYLGNERIMLASHAYHQTFSIMSRTTVESGFKRGAMEADWDFPLPFTNKLRGYVQLFSGYGQSLIEYNHYTNAAG